MSEKTEDRKYAHEFVPHPDEGEAKPLDYLVRYHYAQAQAWHLALEDVIDDPGPRPDLALAQHLRHAHLALLHDALAQGMSGQEAADWASTRNHGESAEWIWERGAVYGLNLDLIRPYRVRDLRTAPASGEAAR